MTSHSKSLLAKRKMNLLPGKTAKSFNLLSIGQRGVGKTVFLAGSYAELHNTAEPKAPQQLWFDCQDQEVLENMETLLGYIARTGQYPPPTLKVKNFNFSLKRQSSWGTKTLAHFRWWDIPGEICSIDNPEFRSMVFNSQGCCVFIDGYALIHKSAYRAELEEIIQQVMPIATLVNLNQLKYAFAVILTKCDLLKPELHQQQLQEGLQWLTNCLDVVKANYRTFYSDIPIIRSDGSSTLKAKGAAAPFLWLVQELSQAYNPGLMNNVIELLTPSQLASANTGGLHSLVSSAGKPSKVKKLLGLHLFPTTRKYILLVSVAIGGLLIASGLVWLDNTWVEQRQAKHVETLNNIATLRQSGQFDQAITLMEQLVNQEPERLEWHLQLANLYELTGQIPKAESVYDQVLAQQQDNLKALVGKAFLRRAQGDNKTASDLLAQAEKVAPAALKPQIRALMIPSAK